MNVGNAFVEDLVDYLLENKKPDAYNLARFAKTNFPKVASQFAFVNVFFRHAYIDTRLPLMRVRKRERELEGYCIGSFIELEKTNGEKND